MSDILEKRRVDNWLLISSLFLIIIGFITLTSASLFISIKNFGFPFYYSLRQLFFGILPGVLLGFFLFKMDFSTLKKWIFPVLCFQIILLFLVLVPGIGIEKGGAKRWLNFGYFTLQPSEPLKLIFTIYLASWLEKRLSKKREKNITFFGFLFILSLISVLLLFQPDFSNFLIISLIAVGVYFLLETPLWHIIFLFFIFFFFSAILILIEPYRLKRLILLFNPDIDPLGMSYQLRQAIIAIGAGGIFGSGIGLSKQKMGVLPQAINDAIFPVFAEEWGFVGCIFLFLLYLIFCQRAIKIGIEKKSVFSKAISFGIAIWIASQTVLNIGGMLNILPLAGVPLPFVGYGGSATFSQIAALGLLLKISKEK
jgi:cell division protein FtsW